MNDMNYFICYVQYVMCYLENDMCDDACYPHGMTFLIRFGKSTNLIFHNSYRLERDLINHACNWCVIPYTYTLYKCGLIPYNSLLLGAGRGDARVYETMLKLSRRGAFIRTW